MARQEMLFSTDGIRRNAVFSPCRKYRYTLERYWDDGKARILFVLLNPSTADATVDDPTNRRGMYFAREWSYGACVFVNLFAFRTSKPAKMMKVKHPVGPHNDLYIKRWAKWADTIVVAWGNHGAHRNRDANVLNILDGYDLHTFGLTKANHPRHPLYLPNSTNLCGLDGK